MFSMSPVSTRPSQVRRSVSSVNVNARTAPEQLVTVQHTPDSAIESPTRSSVASSPRSTESESSEGLRRTSTTSPRPLIRPVNIAEIRGQSNLDAT